MACLTPVTIRIDTPTGPLNSACYEPIRDKIYAVRDNWIYQLNGSTGAKEAEYRFADPGLPGDTHIDYDTGTDTLWATYWRATPSGGAVYNSGKYLVAIDPDDISVVTLHAFTGGMSLGSLTLGWDSGPRHIITRAGIGYLSYTFGGGPPPENRIARINLVTPAVTHTDTISASGSTWANIGYDGTSLFTLANAPSEAVQLRSLTDLSSAGSTDTVAGRYPYGIASASIGVNYIACGNQYLVRATNAGGVGTEIDLGRPNANPHNVRYFTILNKIYIPLYKDDTVAVLDATNDSFEIKTGFSAPWDMVFTASKAFALQHSAIGIKEVV